MLPDVAGPEPAQFDIRPGDLTDARVIALLETHLDGARMHSPPESVHALDLAGLQGPTLTFWVMWAGAEVAGMGALKLLEPGHAEIKSMHTAVAFRGRGVAKAMMDHILATAADRGCRRLSLETGTPDYFQPAHALYRRYGFEVCPPFADYVADGFSLCMTRELPEDLTR